MTQTGTKSACAPVLLIEDEPAVMALVRAVLEGHGYTVVPTESGAEALRLLARRQFSRRRLRHAHSRRRRWRPGLCLDRRQSPGTRLPPGFHHRRYRQRGNRCHTAPHRRALRGKAVSRS